MIKKIIKNIFQYDEPLYHSKFDNNNLPVALNNFIINHPSSVSKYRSLGKRHDGMDFNPEVKKIEDAYNLLYKELEEKYSDDNIPYINEWFSVRNGNPIRFKPFPLCREYMLKGLFSKYLYIYPTNVEGDRNSRNHIVNYLLKEGFNKNIGVENIILSYSTAHAYNMVISAICNRGDVILMTAPNYGIFASYTEINNARVEVLDLKEEDDFYVNKDSLSKRIDEINNNLKEEYKNSDYIPKVVAFLNINPHNPLGKVMNNKNIDILKGIGDVCLEKGIFVIDDLIYRDLTFDLEDKAVFLASFDKYFNNTISLIGLSKSYGLAQLRAGAIIAPTPICRILADQITERFDAYSYLQSEALAGAFNGSKRREKIAKKYFKKLIAKYKYQLSLIEALIYGIEYDNCKEYKNKILKDIKRYTNDKDKLDIILKGIPNVSIRSNTYPESGFFILMDFTKLKGKNYKDLVINDDTDLVKYIYLKTKINFLIGLSIAWPNRDEMVARITFALDPNDLIHNMYLINKAVRELV